MPDDLEKMAAEQIELLTAGLEGLGSEDATVRKVAGDRAGQRIGGLVKAKLFHEARANAIERQAKEDLAAQEARIRAEAATHLTTELALSDAGIRSDFDRKALRDFHATLPEQGRKPIADFVADLKAAKPEELAKLPASIRALFVQPAAGGGDVNPDKNARDAAGGSLTKDGILNMSLDDFGKRYFGAQ